MKGGCRAAWAAGAAAAVIGAAAVSAWPAWDWQRFRDLLIPDKTAQAQAALADWPADSALAARAMIEEYGPPDEADADRLVWSDNGPWLRTVVHKAAPDVLEQSVGYEVAQQRWPTLAGFGHGVAYDARGLELSARSSSEERNFLALNLAAGIAQGRMSPQAADRLFMKTLAESLAGKSSPVMKGLLFATRRRQPASDWRRQSRW